MEITNIERVEERLRVAIEALKEISNWDKELDDKWVTVKNKADYALEKIEIMDRLAKKYKE